jgi:ketosteroid isomerase-like protein
MRLFLITTILLFSFACNKKASSSLTAVDYKSIKNVLDSQVYAWNKGDVKTFMKGYWDSDELRFIGKNGVRYGYKSVESNYLKNYNSIEKMGHLSFDSLIFTQISGEDKVANVTGQWKITGTNNLGGCFSLLFKKIENDWKIIVDHTW